MFPIMMILLIIPRLPIRSHVNATRGLADRHGHGTPRGETMGRTEPKPWGTRDGIGRALAGPWLAPLARMVASPAVDGVGPGARAGRAVRDAAVRGLGRVSARRLRGSRERDRTAGDPGRDGSPALPAVGDVAGVPAAPVRPGADGPPPRRGGICGVLVPSPIEGDSRRECPGPPRGDRTRQSHQALPGAAFVVVLPPGSPVVRVDGRRARPAELGRGTEANKPAVHGGRGMGRAGGGRRSGAIAAGCGVGRPGDRGAPRVLDDRHARLQRCPGHLPGHGRRGRRWGWTHADGPGNAPDLGS